MQDVFDIYTIIFLALAVFIFLRLRSVLGQRTGRERPPYDPYAAREPVRPAGENVVALPNRANEANLAKPDEKPDDAEAAKAPGDRWKGVAKAGTPLAAGLDAVADTDRSFDPAQFLIGARAAYEMIVNAYAEGDRRTLKYLLSRDVYDGFEAAIVDREKRGDTVESHFVSIDNADNHRRRTPRPQCAADRALPVEDGLGDAQQGWRGNRRQRRQGDRRHRRVDICARSWVARSELEAGCHRSWAMKTWLKPRQ